MTFHKKHCLSFVECCLFLRRVFVEFERQRSDHPSHTANLVQPVQEAVYIALKKRHERSRLFLVLKEERSNERRRRLSAQQGERAEAAAGSTAAGLVRSIPPLELPDLGQEQIMITEV